MRRLCAHVSNVTAALCRLSRTSFAAAHMLAAAMNTNGTFVSGPELITVLHVQETLRKAEQLHRVSDELKERRRLRPLFRRSRQTPAPEYEPCPVPDAAA